MRETPPAGKGCGGGPTLVDVAAPSAVRRWFRAVAACARQRSGMAPASERWPCAPHGLLRLVPGHGCPLHAGSRPPHQRPARLQDRACAVYSAASPGVQPKPAAPRRAACLGPPSSRLLLVEPPPTVVQWAGMQLHPHYKPGPATENHWAPGVYRGPTRVVEES